MTNPDHNHNLHTRGIGLMAEDKMHAALLAFRAAASQRQAPSLDLACLKFRMCLCVKRIREEYHARDVSEDVKKLLRSIEDPVDCLRQSWDLLRRVALERPDPLPKLRRDLEDFPVFDKDDDDDDDDEKDGGKDGASRFGLNLPDRRGKRRAGLGGLATWGLDKRGSRKETRDLLQGNILLNMLAIEMEDTGIDPTAPGGGRPAAIPKSKVLDEIASDPSIPMLSLDVAYAVFKELLKEERTIHAGEAFDPANRSSESSDVVQGSSSEGSSTPPPSSPSPSSTPLSVPPDPPPYIPQTPSAQPTRPVGSPRETVGSLPSPAAASCPKKWLYPEHVVHGPDIGKGRGRPQIQEEWW